MLSKILKNQPENHFMQNITKNAKKVLFLGQDDMMGLKWCKFGEDLIQINFTSIMNNSYHDFIIL